MQAGAPVNNTVANFGEKRMVGGDGIEPPTYAV